MRYLFAMIAASSVMLTANPALAAEARTDRLTFTAKYEGGALELVQGKIRATVVPEQLTLVQAGRRLTVPLGKLTAIFCGKDARYRPAAFAFGRVPWKHVETVEAYYVGITWKSGARDGDQSSPAQAVFRLSRNDYRSFLSALQRLTGIQATDTGKVPTIVRVVKEPNPAKTS